MKSWSVSSLQNWVPADPSMNDEAVLWERLARSRRAPLEPAWLGEVYSPSLSVDLRRALCEKLGNAGRAGLARHPRTPRQPWGSTRFSDGSRAVPPERSPRLVVSSTRANLGQRGRQPDGGSGSGLLGSRRSRVSCSELPASPRPTAPPRRSATAQLPVPLPRRRRTAAVLPRGLE